MLFPIRAPYVEERSVRSVRVDERAAFWVIVPLTFPGDGEAFTSPAKATLPLTKPLLWIASCPVMSPTPTLPWMVALLSWMSWTVDVEMTV